MIRGAIAVTTVGTAIAGLIVTGHPVRRPAPTSQLAPTVPLARASRGDAREPLPLRSHHEAQTPVRRAPVRRLVPRVQRPAGGALNWTALAQCESSGDWHANTGNGFYGGVQFDLQTWRSVGGHGLPSDASEAEQIARATVLYRERGRAPWPVCGRYL